MSLCIGTVWCRKGKRDGIAFSSCYFTFGFVFQTGITLVKLWPTIVAAAAIRMIANSHRRVQWIIPIPIAARRQIGCPRQWQTHRSHRRHRLTATIIIWRNMQIRPVRPIRPAANAVGETTNLVEDKHHTTTNTDVTFIWWLETIKHLSTIFFWNIMQFAWKL